MFEKLGQRLGLNAIPQIFFISSAIAIAFVIVAIPFRDGVATLFGSLSTLTYVNFGWFYVVSVSGLLGFLIWVALSRYGSIRLGPDDAEPEYPTVTWFAMLFAAGIGTILMFWGVAEPLSHFANPPLAGIEGGGTEAAQQAMNIALYHFG
ncbi:MAG: BCCT family transporter, partial [Chromatocurvus sp.]